MPLPCTSVSEEANFPSYWAGPELDGLEVTYVVWECGDPAPGDPGGGNVTYIYEDCGGFGACKQGLQIHTYPAQLRYEGMVDLPGTEMILGGVPVTRYQGFVEIYYPDVTVVISGGDGHRKARFIEALVGGPRVLGTLARYGLFFEPECLDDHYCQADRSLRSDTVSFYVRSFTSWVLPFLIALVLGRLWLLLLPVIGWPVYFVGLDAGWWGYGVGESGFYVLIFAIPLGVADVGAGLMLRWLIVSAVRSRRRTAQV